MIHFASERKALSQENWHSFAPTKVKIFLWIMRHDKDKHNGFSTRGDGWTLLIARFARELRKQSSISLLVAADYVPFLTRLVSILRWQAKS